MKSVAVLAIKGMFIKRNVYKECLSTGLLQSTMPSHLRAARQQSKADICLFFKLSMADVFLFFKLSMADVFLSKAMQGLLWKASGGKIKTIVLWLFVAQKKSKSE